MKQAYLASVEVQNTEGGWDRWQRIVKLTDDEVHECHAHSVCIISICFPDRLMAREGGKAIFVRDAWIRLVKEQKHPWWQFWRRWL